MPGPRLMTRSETGGLCRIFSTVLDFQNEWYATRLEASESRRRPRMPRTGELSGSSFKLAAGPAC